MRNLWGLQRFGHQDLREALTSEGDIRHPVVKAKDLVKLGRNPSYGKTLVVALS